MFERARANGQYDGPLGLYAPEQRNESKSETGLMIAVVFWQECECLLECGRCDTILPSLPVNVNYWMAGYENRGNAHVEDMRSDSDSAFDADSSAAHTYGQNKLVYIETRSLHVRRL